MSKPYSEDLFAESTMSFGDHLEELRGALVRALVGVMIGTAVGLSVANYVVHFIESPLKKALQEYYTDKAINQLMGSYATDEITPDKKKEVEDFAETYRFVPRDVYIERKELTRIVAEEPAEGEDYDYEEIINQKIPPPDTDLVKTRLWEPLETEIQSLNPQEPFIIWLKAGVITGLVLSSPWVFYQIWIFVAAGLYPHERQYVHYYLPFSIGLFLAGASLAFVFAFEHVLSFLFGFNEWLNIDPDPRISEWISFVLFLPLGFGIAFQLPLVMMFLNRIGVFTVESYLEKWRIAILVIFVLSMFLTPADPVSLMLLAAPLTLLYFGGIALCKWMPHGQNPFAEAYEP